MKILILVALILQLVIVIKAVDEEESIKFGDILVFPFTWNGITLRHFAIYVGPKSENDVGQKQGEDIFHTLGETCEFGTLAPEDKTPDNIFNYLDKYLGKPLDKDVKKRIIEARGDCTPYHPTNNNCEHLATYVRYGAKVSKQKGTIARVFQSVYQYKKNKKAMQRRKVERIEEFQEDIENMKNDIIALQTYLAEREIYGIVNVGAQPPALQ